MFRTIATILCLSALSQVQAQVIVPVGTKATLQVTYTYENSGNYYPVSQDVIRDWNMRRSANVTATFSAKAPQMSPVLHKIDGKQQAKLDSMTASAKSARQKMQPMSNDMFAIAMRCEQQSGGSENPQFEACVEKAVTGYSDSQKMAAAQSADTDIANIDKLHDDKRFQPWAVVSQSGSYSLTETYRRQVFDAECTRSNPCTSSEQRTGNGPILLPYGPSSNGGAVLMEVDSSGKDIIIGMPKATGMEYKVTRSSNIPDDPNNGHETKAPGWLDKADTVLTLSIGNGLQRFSGRKTVQVGGQHEDGGTLTVSWTFTPAK
jgi:flagellar hook-basal body complex protein FliE